MAEAIRGKGVISGIAIGKIMLAGQNLDGYLVNYQPESKEVEAKKAQDALTAVAETLRENIDRLQKQEMVEQAAIMEAHRMMVQDPALHDSIISKIEELGNAPQSVLKAAVATSGIPAKLYTDNGAPYVNDQLSLICGAIGTVLLHTKVRDGASKDSCSYYTPFERSTA